MELIHIKLLQRGRFFSVEALPARKELTSFYYMLFSTLYNQILHWYTFRDRMRYWFTCRIDFSAAALRVTQNLSSQHWAWGKFLHPMIQWADDSHCFRCIQMKFSGIGISIFPITKWWHDYNTFLLFGNIWTSSFTNIPGVVISHQATEADNQIVHIPVDN